LQELQGCRAEEDRGGEGARDGAEAGRGSRHGVLRGDREGVGSRGGHHGDRAAGDGGVRRRCRGSLRRGQGHGGATSHALGVLRREVSGVGSDRRGTDSGTGSGWADVSMRDLVYFFGI
jgi:hypothetical protein